MQYRKSPLSHRPLALLLQPLEPRTLLSGITPNDPQFPNQYALAKIDAPDAWNITTGAGGGGGSNTVVVAVLDTGVDITHSDLAANIWTNPSPNANPAFPNDLHGWNFLNNSNDVSDNFIHGTSVAGVIGAVGNNSIGIAGVDWNVKILPVEVGTATGVNDNAVAAGINYVIGLKKAGVNIVAINASYISFTPPTAAEINGIRNAGNAGILYVAAAGNTSTNLDTLYPGNYLPSNMILVAATDENDNLASFSNYGHSTVAVGAPGADITTTVPGDNYLTLSGTSYAAPIVSGIAALLKSQYPNATMSQIKNAILSSGDPDPSLAGKTITGKRVNAFKALQALETQIKPIGAVEALTTAGIAGWAFDANAGANPIQVQISIDNVLQPPITANQNDLNAPQPAYTTHGFDYTFNTLAYGKHTIKVFALDDPSGALTQIGAGTVTIDTAPTGAIESTTNSITGWAQDTDTPTKSIQVKFFIDNKPWKTLTANLSRPDLISTLGSPNHGFNIPLSQLPNGIHRLDAYAIDTLTGAATLIGTATVSNNRPPVGLVESLTATSLLGYAYDPDTTKPVQVRYTIDDGAPVFTTANLKRNDSFTSHGFNILLPQLPYGSHTITIAAVDPTSDQLVQLASQTLVLNPTATPRPTCTVTTLTPTLIAGTVSETNATSPLTLRIDIDGKPGKPFLSTATSDPTTDTFSQSLKLPAGPHRIDLYALDPAGTLTLLSRQLVNYTPSTATLESATTAALIGFALSPSAKNQQSFLRLDIDGLIGALITANLKRPDSHTGHGFNIPLPPLPSGTHQITLTLIDPTTLDATLLYNNPLTFP